MRHQSLFLALAMGLFFLGAVHSSSSIAQEVLPVFKSAAMDYVEGEVNDGYIKPTYKNLSQLYWALAMFELNDDEAVDGYLYINECELYQSYIDRDFELGDLREATRGSILKNLASFPKRFEIFMPIGLDRYDLGKEKFSLSPQSFFLSAKKLEVSHNSPFEQVCRTEGVLPRYPHHFILVFSIPFTLVDMPVPPEIAELYLNIVDKEASKGTRSRYWEYYGLSKFKRVAFLRLQVTMTQFREYGHNYQGERVPEIFGTVDGYEIYADSRKELLLYKYVADDGKSVDSQKKWERVRIPEGPLIPAESATGGESSGAVETAP